MAALAIYEANVAKVDIVPAVWVVAGAARARIMVARGVVALGAVVHACVCYPNLHPGGSEMATAAVAGIVTVGCQLAVAAVAIGLVGVVKRYVLPGDVLVTAVALAVVMVGWLFLAVAALAILVIGMVEGNICPGCGAVAALAASLVMQRGRVVLVAGETVG